MKEYLFSTIGGYRKFYIQGKNLEDAEKNFEKADIIHERCGFELKDLPIRYEIIDKKKC